MHLRIQSYPFQFEEALYGCNFSEKVNRFFHLKNTLVNKQYFKTDLNLLFFYYLKKRLTTFLST